MDFNNFSEEEKKKYAELMFQLLSSPEEMLHWIEFFLNLKMPTDTIDPESTSNPLDAIWQIYNAFKKNDGKNPGYILLSARESMKTVSVSILEVLLMLHFQLDIAHAAAIEAQASVNLQYIEGFILRINPLLEAAGWVPKSTNKRLIKYKTPQGKMPFIKVLICSVKGMNSLHSNFIALDELDLVDPKALKESKNITGYSKGIHGITVYLSTRKYAFGPMADAVENAEKRNHKVLRWNILDVTERCDESRHLPNENREDRYVAKNLPLQNISVEEYNFLSTVEKGKYELIEKAFSGCKSCSLLPVCKMKLAHKPKTSVGGFYKPIDSVKQKFIDNDADTAEAQILCWRPGSVGLVYPRFSTSLNNGNVMSVQKAYQTLYGENALNSKNVTSAFLFNCIKSLEIPTFASIDWGFSNDTSIIIAAKMPSDEIWILDCFSSPGLEFVDILNQALTMQENYKPLKWFADPAMPSHIKSFNRHGMVTPKFTKDVPGGIEAVRSKISNAAGKRMLKIIDTPNNQKIINAVSKHRFILDGQSNPTTSPDDEPQIADICDALRYLGQNLFPVRGTYKPMVASDHFVPKHDPNSPEGKAELARNIEHNKQMKEEIAKLTNGNSGQVSGTGKKGGFFWGF